MVTVAPTKHFQIFLSYIDGANVSHSPDKQWYHILPVSSYQNKMLSKSETSGHPECTWRIASSKRDVSKCLPRATEKYCIRRKFIDICLHRFFFDNIDSCISLRIINHAHRVLCITRGMLYYDLDYNLDSLVAVLWINMLTETACDYIHLKLNNCSC